MTDTAATLEAIAAWTQIETDHAERARLAMEAIPTNKDALFDALSAAGITSVVVSFDGGGDEGQIESVEARNGDELVDLPDVSIEMRMAGRKGPALEPRTITLSDGIDELAYHLLGIEHLGWENNDGAFGEFRFDVTERVITLDHNERYTEIATSVHEW